MRAWIEMATLYDRYQKLNVALFMRAWIEINLYKEIYICTLSPSS